MVTPKGMKMKGKGNTMGNNGGQGCTATDGQNREDPENPGATCNDGIRRPLRPAGKPPPAA